MFRPTMMFILGLFALLNVNATQASLLTYTMTTDYTVSGTIGSDSFTNATLTATMTADSTNVETGTIDGYTTQWNPGTISFTITDGSNVYSGDIVAEDDYFTAVYSLDSGPIIRVSQMGIAQINDAKTESFNGASWAGVFSTYNSLSSTGSYTGSGGGLQFSSQTTIGNLDFTEDLGGFSGEFQFVISDGGGNNAVPEPATLAVWSIVGLCGVGFGIRRRMKKAA